MDYRYNGVRVNFKFIKKGQSVPFVFLHGWGRSKEDFADLLACFPEKSALLIDLPPFGKSEKNLENWNLFSYVGLVISLCEHLGIAQADFVGHSFGGRIAIVLSSINCTLVRSCILIDSAGMRPRRKIKYYYRVFKYKLGKKFGRDLSKYGSKDYSSLSPKLRPLFNRIINLHLEEYAKKIQVKTLIIWGRKDSDTPFYMAKRLNRLIENSQLVVSFDSGHFSFLESPLFVFNAVNKFIKEV